MKQNLDSRCRGGARAGEAILAVAVLFSYSSGASEVVWDGEALKRQEGREDGQRKRGDAGDRETGKEGSRELGPRKHFIYPFSVLTFIPQDPHTGLLDSLFIF